MGDFLVIVDCSDDFHFAVPSLLRLFIEQLQPLELTHELPSDNCLSFFGPRAVHFEHSFMLAIRTKKWETASAFSFGTFETGEKGNY